MQVFRKHQLGDHFIDLISKVLAYSPYKRITPIQALAHPFFNELRDEMTYKTLRQKYGIPDLFDFKATKEGKPHILESLVPKWY